ncbi:hypothetical protein ACFQ4L_10330 [Lapidilactobacillus mulanensis]|uniref:Uncharacterized protein n=1 Tax=Lapidilactobacillus mulanensis TaxID=2485999 RepID=A0ABW4DP75_9LACO|nr:hypothetical protein [Lapidilactobacillus mulanensis]
MAEFKYSWRDEYGSDMDKAKALLSDDSISGTYISNVADISRQGVSNYRTGKTDIESANWSVVTKLSRAYEADWIQKQIGDNQTDFVLFIQKISSELNTVANNYETKGNEEMTNVFDRLNEMTGSDIIQLIDLYKAYKDDEG